MAEASFELGAAEETMANIETLATPLIPPSRAIYQPGAKRITLPNGHVRWLGQAWAEWHFPLLTDAQRDQLKSYCTGTSAVVYLCTLISDSGSTYDDFSAVMIWPDDEERVAGFVKNLVIRYQKLVAL